MVWVDVALGIVSAAIVALARWLLLLQRQVTNLRVQLARLEQRAADSDR